MAITSGMCTSFKAEAFSATHAIKATGGDVFKIALYTSAASLSPATTAYSATNEVTGTNYTAGGITLTNLDPASSGTTGYAQFADAVFSNVTLTCRGALIYNSSKSNKAVAVLDFGSDKTATGGDFTVQMPVFDATNALLAFE